MLSSDRIYRYFLSSLKFFSRGWGPVETYERLVGILPAIMDRSRCNELVTQHTHPVIAKKVSSSEDYEVWDGKFTSPLSTLLPGFLPKEAETARFELLLPQSCKIKESLKPLYIHLAGTGDHYFWRRKYLLALPLLKTASMGSLILENPYYGSRKPRDQTRSQLHYVSDLFVMGLALIMECVMLLGWLERKGLGPVGLTGISMGGHNASLSASVWPKPVPVVPCLSWTTCSSAFTEGALFSSVSWKLLEEQLFMCRLGQDQARKRILEQIADQSVHLNTGLGLKFNSDSQSSRVPGKDTLRLMEGLFNYSTHFENYPKPLSPELALFLVAKDDSYIPRANVSDVRQLWKGCEVRYVEGGHVSTALFKTQQMRKALVDAMNKLIFHRYEAQSFA